MNLVCVAMDAPHRWNQALKNAAGFSPIKYSNLIVLISIPEYMQYDNGVSLNDFFRENPSTPGPLPERNPNEVTRENRGLNGDFLTLAPPAASFPLISRHKHPYAYSGHQEQELSDLEYIHSQVWNKTFFYRCFLFC